MRKWVNEKPRKQIDQIRVHPRNPWLMKNAGQYKLPKPLSDTDLRRFTLVFGLYCFNPCSSVESVAKAKKAEDKRQKTEDRRPNGQAREPG